MIFEVLLSTFVENAAIQGSYALFLQINWGFSGVYALLSPAHLHILDQLSVNQFEVYPTFHVK